MKKTTSILAALLIAGGTNARPFPQSAAPAGPTQPSATVGSVEVTQTPANAAAGQQQYSQAEVTFTPAEVAQTESQETEHVAVLTASSAGQDPFSGGNSYNYGYGGQGFSFTSAEQPHSALVIRTSETTPETLAAMKEDLNIMGRILEKALSKSDDDEQARAMGIRLTGIMSGGGAKYLQIEGGGALFLLNVDFPLLGPPEKAPAEKTTTSNSSTWNEAKRELYGHPDNESGSTTGREEFDSKRVDKLKTAVLEALKNAANMSHLPESETVTVVINGGSSHARGGFGNGFGGSMGGGSWSGFTSSAGGMGGGGGGGFGGGGGRGSSNGSGVGFGGGGASSNGSGTATVDGKGSNDKKAPRMGDRLQHIVARSQGHSAGVMTIRVAKGDIDAFAGGKMDLDEFHKKATVTVY